MTEALNEMRANRDILDLAISHLEKALSALSNGNPVAHASIAEGHLDVPKYNKTSPRSYIDDAVVIISDAGHPLHARDLAEKMSKIRNRVIPRASMESTLIRHITDLKERARLSKTDRSTYGLADHRNGHQEQAELLA